MSNEEILELLKDVSMDSSGFVECPQKIQDATRSNGYFKYCYIFTKEDFVVKFSKRTRKDGKDVCVQEVENYNKAVEMGVDRVLLKIEYIGENRYGVKFYKQEKIDLVFDNMERSQRTKYQKMTKTVRRQIVSKTTSVTHIDFLWMGTVISLYGKNFGKRFAEWLRTQQVTDLHNANLGFKNHRPFIFDYGGVL